MIPGYRPRVSPHSPFKIFLGKLRVEMASLSTNVEDVTKDNQKMKTIKVALEFITIEI